MLTALDGKITGPYMDTGAIEGPAEAYERTNSLYHPQAWLCGRVTTDENFTHYRKPALDEEAPLATTTTHRAVSTRERRRPSMTNNATMSSARPFENLGLISPRPLLFVAGSEAESRYFSEDAYRQASEPKELYIVPGATHVDL